MTFKEKLVILRKSKGLTQDELASAVGVSRQAVYKWESGQSYPEVPKLLEIKHLFNISIDELLDDNYDIPLPEKKKRKRALKAESAPKVATPKAAPAPKAEPVVVETPAPKAEEVPVIVAEPEVEPVTFVETPAPKAEPVPAVVSAPTIEPAPVAAPAPKIDTVPAPTAEELSATKIDFDDLALADEQENAKKNSFFGRLFGRR